MPRAICRPALDSLGEGLHARTIWSVSPDPDGRRIWAGTADGLAVLEDGRFRLVVPGSALASPHVTSVLAEDGRVWLGTLRGVRVLDHSGPPLAVILHGAAMKLLHTPVAGAGSA